MIGNALEFYDFTTYAFFAREIGAAFFPVHSQFMRLILALATFGAGFILRPIGSVLIGRYGDRHGRKPAMLFSFALMGGAILALALTPSYARIGVVAPILVLVWRLAQGFALGGEVGPTTAFLVEASPAARRGLYSAWQGASQNLATIAGGLVGVALAAMAGAAGLQAWGWRAAFLLGALVLPFGLWLRRQPARDPAPRRDRHRPSAGPPEPARPRADHHAGRLPHRRGDRRDLRHDLYDHLRPRDPAYGTRNRPGRPGDQRRRRRPGGWREGFWPIGTAVGSF